MCQLRQAVIGVVAAIVVTGCRAATRVTEVPRIDLALTEGNRGYLVGRPPEAPELKATRQMIDTTVEVPSFYKPKRTGVSAGQEEIAPPEMDMGSEAAPAHTGGAPGKYDTYVVQKGESLWSIAAKPEIYGKATRWRLIFDANRDLLKSPDRVRPGMTLKIPRGDGGGSTTYGEEGVTYRK